MGSQLQVVFLLLPLLQGVLPNFLPPASRRKLSEITLRIQQLNSGAQVPCNDTRVAQVPFRDPKVSEQELLCQAARVLTEVTGCRRTYEPLVTNLQSLQGRRSCSLPQDTQIFLRNFLPGLGNFTQGLYRRLATSPVP
ncbi:uncharacterized protein LRP34_006920 [Phaethornis superciliosus]